MTSPSEYTRRDLIFDGNGAISPQGERRSHRYNYAQKPTLTNSCLCRMILPAVYGRQLFVKVVEGKGGYMFCFRVCRASDLNPE